MNSENSNDSFDLTNILARLENNSQDEPMRIFNQFDKQNWSDWIEDIITYGFAYPISSITSDGDILVDIVDYLKEHPISLSHYEDAIVVWVNQFDVQDSNSKTLERLLNVLINIRSKNSTEVLVKIVTSRNNNFVKGKTNFVKSLALLAIAKAVKIEESVASGIYNYIRMVGLLEMVHDPVFFGNALRFTFYHLRTESFFELLTYIFEILDVQAIIENDNEYLIDRHITVLIDKFEELHYQDIGKFYSNTFNWLTQVLISEKVFTNKIFIKTIERLIPVMLEYPFAADMFAIKQGKTNVFISNKGRFIQYEYALLMRVLTTIFVKSPTTLLSRYHILHAFAFIVSEEPGKISFLEIFLQNNKLFLRRFYDILPDMAYHELSCECPVDVIETVIRLTSDAIYSSNISQEQLTDVRRDNIKFLAEFAIYGEDKIKDLDYEIK